MARRRALDYDCGVKHSIRLVALVALLLVAACPSTGTKPDTEPPGPSADFLVGSWEDSEGTELTFEKVDGQVKVARIVDYDGEVFEVRSAGFVNGTYTFTYLVPSTGYVVTMRILDSEGDEIDAEWSNRSDTGEEDSGTEVLTRQ